MGILELGGDLVHRLEKIGRVGMAVPGDDRLRTFYAIEIVGEIDEVPAGVVFSAVERMCRIAHHVRPGGGA